MPTSGHTIKAFDEDLDRLRALISEGSPSTRSEEVDALSHPSAWVPGIVENDSSTRWIETEKRPSA